jgi:uncharacterized membrane protein YhaH (DUF805 family)
VKSHNILNAVIGFFKKWFSFSGTCDRETWWRALAFFVPGVYFGVRVYFSGLSFWLKRPDPFHTAIAAALIVTSSWILISVVVRRSRALSLPRQFHFLILLTPVWIIALGTLSGPRSSGIEGYAYAVFSSATGISWVFLIFFLLAGSIYFSPKLSSSLEFTSGDTSGLPTTRECVELGVDYFKDIGSYPLLSSGRDARTEANDRCGRSSLAFGRP